MSSSWRTLSFESSIARHRSFVRASPPGKSVRRRTCGLRAADGFPDNNWFVGQPQVRRRFAPGIGLADAGVGVGA